MRLQIAVRCYSVSVACVLLVAVSLSAQEWAPKDIIHTQYAGSVQFSNNNQMVVWTKSKAVKEKDRFVSEIYLTYLNSETDDEPVTVQLTQGDDSNYSPFFSNDDSKVYFLSSRDDGNKLWSLNLMGGEAHEVHEFDEGVRSLRWQNDSTLLLISNDGPTKYERDLKEKKDDTQVIEDTVYWRRSQVYAFSLEDKSLRRISNFDYPVTSYQSSRDGQWMITRLQMSPHYPSDAQPKAQYYLHNLQDGTNQRILQGYQEPGGFIFDNDSEGFYFTRTISSDPEWNGSGIDRLSYYDLSSGNAENIDLDWENGLSSNPIVVGSGVLVRLANGPTHKLAYYTKSDGNWSKSEPDLGEMQEHVSISDVSEDGSEVLFVHSTASQLPVYYHADLTISDAGSIGFENHAEWTSLNDNLKKKKKARSEIIRWTGALGDEVNGILYYPIDYEEGKSYPLLLSIHGGPAGVDTDSWRERWSTYPNLWTQRNAFVLKPNYHGSSNHGQAFVESIKGHYYDLELEDITNGIKVLAEEGKVDTSQMGVMGWSNGAILATMLTVRYPTMFKVATPGAGDVNWTSDFGTCRFGVSFDQSYFGGAPWDDVDGQTFNPVYIEKSPLFEMEKVTTPTMIFHGSNDRAVPRDQGWEYYRALQQIDKAPVRFLWFPNQPHGLRKISHQMRKMEEEIAWIDHWLFNKPADKNEAVDEDSRLARLIKVNELAQQDGLIGATNEGVLIPQVAVVADDSISIGIVEVTNAQYAALVTDYEYARTAANKPVSGLTTTQVERYLQALSSSTGVTYRLPNEAEAKALHKQAKKVGSKENTIEYWAGYKPTSRELDLLSDKLDDAGDLLMQCAQFAPVKVGEAEVYDLGGNAAEMSNNGHYGFSANQLSGEDSSNEPLYVGFRVIREN